MKIVVAMIAAVVLAAAGTALNAEEVHPREESAVIASLAINGGLDTTALEYLQKADSPDRLAVLDRTFDELSSKNERQMVAVLAIASGSRDDRYIRYLESFVREALKDPAPGPFFNESGHPPLRKRTTILFQAWCKQRGLSVEEGLSRVLGVNARDVSFVVLANDRRFWPVLEQAVNSSDPTMAAGASAGLASLNWTASLPLILDAAERLPEARRALLISIAFPTGDEQQIALAKAVKRRANAGQYEELLSELRGQTSR